MLISLTNSCGFQLQVTDIGELRSVSLSGPAAGGVRSALARSLENYGVVVVAADPNILDIRLVEVRTSRRPVSTSARIDAAQYELRLDLDASITQERGSISREITLSAYRIYSVDSLNLSGSFEEQEMLISDINDEVADLILRRIEALLDKGII